MKILKKLMKITYYTFFIVGLMQNIIFAQPRIADTLSFDISALNNMESHPKQKLPENPGFNLIEKEINSLKRRFPGKININLADKKSQNIAPNLYNQVEQIVSKLSDIAKIEQPSIIISIGNNSKTYNASIKMNLKLSEKTITTTQDNQIINVDTKIKKKISGKLMLGENLIKVIFWNKNYKSFLESVIAHEIGHLKAEHFNEKTENEHEADAIAINLIGKQNKETLAKTINLAELSGQLYNLIKANQNKINLNIKDTEKVVRIVSNEVIDKAPMLGQLGQSTTHTKFAVTINTAIEKVLAEFNADIHKNIVDFSKKLHKALIISCNDQNSLFNSSEYEITLKCEDIEERTNKLYSSGTHPAPIDRINFILSL